jgi:nitrile hydratase beta subunit
VNGPHDMGGFTGFGPVVAEQNEPVFHEPWEARTFAMVLATGMAGCWTLDESRKFRERLPALRYWGASYYEYRHYALEAQLLEAGMVTSEELAAGHSLSPPIALKRVATSADALAILARGAPVNRPSGQPQLFTIGDKVRARNITPGGHTRLPRYARGNRGEVVTVHGAHVFPDSIAHGKGEDPHWLYTVRFTARELWGKDTTDSVCIDLWEPYLEAV